MPKVVVVGDANVDVIVPYPRFLNEERTQVEYPQIGIQGGGTSANTAAALAKLGLDVSFVGTVGDDQYGRFVMQDFKDAGVDVTGLVADSTLSTVGVFAFVDDRGERYLWGWPRERQSFKVLDENLVPMHMIREADWVHSSGMCLTYDTSARETIIRIFEQAHDAGVPTSFDLNLRVDDGVLDPDFAAALERIIPNVDYLLGSGPDEFAYLGDDDMMGNATAYAVDGRTVIVRDGARGSIGLTQDGLTESPAFRVNVEDTIGAGDVYNAGFIAARLAGASLAESLREGNAVSAYKVARRGARSSPGKPAERHARISTNPKNTTNGGIPMENKKKVILDCDPGHDDAFGIMLAVQHLDVLGITTIGGNCTLENVTRNAIKVLEVLGVADRIGVYPGHSCPMVAPLVTAPQFHGETGLDGPVLPEPTHAAQNKHAVDFIVDTVMSTDDVTLIATGPLTNIASAINREPRIVERVKELCIMGGSVTYGNWTPAAEFNIFVDPEAASRVFNSGMHVKMTGINLTRQCELTAKHVAKFREIGTKAANLAADLTDFFIGACEEESELTGATMHDACAVAWVIDPSLITAVPMHIDIELHGALTRGMTVCDYRHLRGTVPAVDLERTPTMGYRGEEPNAEAALELDFPGFVDLLNSTLENYD